MPASSRTALSLSMILALAAGAFGQVTSEVHKLTASDGVDGDELGSSIVMRGATLVVGAEHAANTGKAYVYTEGGGRWVEDAVLTPSDFGANLFGASIALEGDVLAVGSPQYNLFPGVLLQGAVYVFVDEGAGWVESERLDPSDPGDFGWFGGSVSISGDTMLIGSPCRDSVVGVGAGAAYVFVQEPGGWVELLKLSASDAAELDAFGSAVALEGDLALISAPADDDNGEDSGSVYVFERIAGIWTETGKLLASDGAADDLFGTSLALDGDTAVIGATKSPHNAPCCTGAAYVFERVAGVWTETQILVPAASAIDDNVGVSVAIDGDLIAVGAHRTDRVGVDSGTSYTFERVAGTWTESVECLGSDTTNRHAFGGGVAVSGGLVAVGAGQRDGTIAGAGAAYVFDRQPEPGVGQCFGSGCPCANDSANTGCVNSTGAGGRLTGQGSTSAAADDLVLRAGSLPPDNNGLFYMGDALGAAPLFDGLQCALGTSFRFLNSIQNSGSGGTMTHTGFAAESGGLIVSGTTWHFHCWHRDANGGSPCGTGANLTNVYSVTFAP